MATYGHDMLYSARWPTADHGIPFRLFFQLSGALVHLEAQQQFRTMLGTAHAIGVAFAEKNDIKMRRKTRELSELAYPQET